MRVLMAAAVCAVLVPWGAASRLQSRQPLAPLLADRFGLTESERSTVAAGYEAVRALSTQAPDGVAAIGAIAINARPSLYLEWAERFADFDRGSSVQAVRQLSQPPSLSDFSGLALSADELRDLSRCRVGACTLQLDADSIGRLAAIDWRRRDAGEEATQIVRAVMFDVAKQYAVSGNSGLPHYHDSKRATDVRDNLESLIAEEEASARAPAPLLSLLRGFPAPLPAGATSYLYWTTNAFGLKPTTRLNHTVVYRPNQDGVTGIIATKLLYATHYFHGALDMRYIVADPAQDDRFVLVMVTRTRSDGLTGLAGSMIGGTVRRRAIHSLRTYLRFTKEMVEKRQRFGARGLEP